MKRNEYTKLRNSHSLFKILAYRMVVKLIFDERVTKRIELSNSFFWIYMLSIIMMISILNDVLYYAAQFSHHFCGLILLKIMDALKPLKPIMLYNLKLITL